MILSTKSFKRVYEKMESISPRLRNCDQAGTLPENATNVQP
jgi:hypothetical protein